MSNENHNDSWEVEEVKNLGLEYFWNLIQEVENNGREVYQRTKDILKWWESGKPLTEKQAIALMNFKNCFEG